MNAFLGTRQLIRLALRRDRVSLPIWLLVPAVMVYGTTSAYIALYPSGVDRAPLTATIGRNPALVALTGPAFDLSTPGGFTAWRVLGFLGVLVALMAIFTVTRHTRAEEDTGRHELLAAGVVGRSAPLGAAVLVAGGASSVAGGLAALGILAAGALPVGALAFGAALAGIGWVFAGIAAVAAQVGSYARTANAIAGTAIGAAFLARAAGDATDDARWLSWLSPIGWGQQLRPFADERWWVLVLPLAATVVTVAGAFVLLPRRDAGAGLLPDRAGPAGASPALSGPFGLAWRLQRGSLLGWSTGLIVAGAAFGAVAFSITDLVESNPQMRMMVERMGGSAILVDAFLAQVSSMFGMVAALYGVQATLRMRAEETSVRLEPVLATAVTRLRWMSGHVLFGVAGATVVLAVAGLATGLSHGARIGDVPGALATMFGAAVVQAPAVWIVVGAVTVLYGLLPRFSGAGWGVASAFLLLTLFGPILDLPEVVRDATPFTHVPKLPAESFTFAPVAALTAVAVALLTVGMAGFRRRDIG